MREVLALTRARLEAFGKRPLYALLADRAVPAAVRLSFVPRMAHFIMSFSDLCTLVFYDDHPDELGRIVNAHAVEDCEHWRWFLHDLEQLGHLDPLTLPEALRLLWGEETRRTRLLTYRLCQLALGKSSLQKLVVILVLEATAKLGFERVSQVARELDRELIYFGGHHLETEAQHTLLTSTIQETLESIRLDDETRRELCGVVDRAFDAFDEMVDELARVRVQAISA
jgi:hypothetical protein